MGNGVIPLMVVIMVPIIAGTIGQRVLDKRSAAASVDYPDYSTKYDEYPNVYGWFYGVHSGGIDFNYRQRSSQSCSPADPSRSQAALRCPKNVLVVPKRAALLFDQLMVALQKVVDKQGRGELGDGRATYSRSSGSSMPAENPQIVPSADEETMDLQRRGQAKGRVYWRCYFNAVTCFKRK